MSTVEEFLIPKNQFMKEQPYCSQILNDPRVQHSGAQFSFLNPMRPNENTDKENQEIWDTREATDPIELSNLHADKILQNLSMLAPPKFTRTEKKFTSLKNQKTLSWTKMKISLLTEFSFLNRMRPIENTDKENKEILDTREATDPTELSNFHADKFLQNLSMLARSKFTRTEKTVNLIKESKTLL